MFALFLCYKIYSFLKKIRLLIQKYTVLEVIIDKLLKNVKNFTNGIAIFGKIGIITV